MTTNKYDSASPPLSNSQHSENIKISFFKNLIFQIQEILEQHKQKTRQSLQIKQPRLSIFLSILPFFVGFMQYIQRKYTTSVLLEKNIPAYSFPTEKINLETLKSIKKETELSSLLKDGKIYWSETHLTSTTPQNQTLSFFKVTPYITSIKSSILSNESGKEENFPLQSEQFSQIPIHNLYEQLDELPNKIQSSFENFPNRPQFVSKNLSIPQLTDKFLKNHTLNLTNNLTIFSTADLGLPSYQAKQLNLNGIHFKKLKQSRKFSGIESNKTIFPFVIVRENNYKNFNALTQQFYNLFLISGDTPIFQNKKTKVNSNYFSNIEKYWGNIDDPTSLLTFLSSVSQLQTNPTLFSSRIMSGYRYPDMSISQVFWYLFEQNVSFGKESKKIQIDFPKNFSTIRQYSVIDWNPTKFLVEIQNVQIQDSENISNLYSGPIIEISKDTGLDWNINAKQQIQTFFQRTFSSGNPLTNSIENFFGLFQSPEHNISLNVDLNSNYWFTQLPFFRNGVITNSDKGIIPFERSFQIPFISTKEWNYYLDRLTTKNNANVEKEFIEISLPILETRFSNQEKPRFFFGEKAFIDYEFFIPSKTKNVIQTNFILPTRNYLDEENFGNQLSSGLYQRLISTFSTKNSTILFSDLWEPLTFNSWLIVSQIGFAFLVFSILKALADNYGRELLVYLLDLVALLGFVDEDLKQEIEILMGQREKGFRIISKLSKTFKDIAGIEKLLPEIIEIVWFLRNSGRQFSLSKNLPRGILLTGPPGTGKTLLVQAIAGEANVPVLALSGSSLLEPGESGALKLEILFQEARKLAPCIVFIDEIDTLAEKRNQVLQNPMGADELLESLQVSSTQSKQSELVSLGDNGRRNIEDSTADNMLTQQDMQREKLRILMQFLVELDGIQGRDGVVVLAATNRPEMLDPAILRPGRFDRVLELGLPSKEKRQEILQLYSSNLGAKETVSWNYLVNRTAGFSAADLASIMNQSSLKAITKNTQHTIETIEHGIDRITTFESQKPTQSQKNTISTLRQAYYQAGKVVTSMFLEHHPPTLVTYLWPRRKNVRALQISKNLQKYFFQYARRIELEHRIIGCYSGKAAEILFLQFSAPKNSDMNISDTGIDDIQFAQTLIQCMIEKWYLYSKEVATEKLINIADNRNLQEYLTNNAKLTYFENLLQITQANATENAKDLSNPSNVDVKDLETPLNQQTQNYFPLPWWQYQIATEFEISSRMFANWYRLYLPDPQEIEQNLEWAPPDEFYHGNTLLKDLSKSLKWNDFEALHTNYSIHSLILQSFNEAVFLLDQNRELLDKLSFQLLKNEILREPEIENIFKNFKLENIELGLANNPEFINPGKNEVIISSSWGIKSRKSENQRINFGKI